jgi:hypothetical protein
MTLMNLCQIVLGLMQISPIDMLTMVLDLSDGLTVPVEQDLHNGSSKLQLSPECLTIDSSIVVPTITSKQIRYKEPFNPEEADHVEQFTSDDIPTTNNIAVRQSLRFRGKQPRNVHNATQNTLVKQPPTHCTASKWNKLFEPTKWTVGTMFVPIHIMVESSVVMHPKETTLYDLGLVHGLKSTPPAPNIENI